ncbi:MAG: hypothetical protein ACJAUG_000898 [Halioglobus sp.]|jgi:hypothetical protein
MIWCLTALIYALFWCWYVGFKKKITPEEVEATMGLYQETGSWTVKQKQSIRQFLLNDDGKDFVMVNLIHLKKPIGESRQKLAAYQKIFLGSLLLKAGHPVMIVRAASGNVENVSCDHSDDWNAAGMIRYRSRRDLMEMLPATIGSDHHNLKLESLEKTFAFPSSPWFMFGGPRIVVALLIALAGALAHLIVV